MAGSYTAPGGGGYTQDDRPVITAATSAAAATIDFIAASMRGVGVRALAQRATATIMPSRKGFQSGSRHRLPAQGGPYGRQ